MQREIPNMTILPNLIGCKLMRYVTAGTDDPTYGKFRSHLKDSKRTRMIWQVPQYDQSWDTAQLPQDNFEWSKAFRDLYYNRPPLWILTTLAHETLLHIPVFRGCKPPFQTDYACQTLLAVADNDTQIVQFEIAMANLGGCNARECYDFALKLQALEESWYHEEQQKLTGAAAN
jgi:hypothetical protein